MVSILEDDAEQPEKTPRSLKTTPNTPRNVPILEDDPQRPPGDVSFLEDDPPRPPGDVSFLVGGLNQRQQISIRGLGSPCCAGQQVRRANSRCPPTGHSPLITTMIACPVAVTCRGIWPAKRAQSCSPVTAPPTHHFLDKAPHPDWTARSVPNVNSEVDLGQERPPNLIQDPH